MENLTKDLFTVVGKNVDKMDSISRPNLSFWKDAWRRLKKNRAAFCGLCILILFGLLAIFAPMFSRYTYTAMDTAAVHAVPSAEHWLGADSAGRDLWVRIWMGARVSLSIGLIAAVVNALVGALIGGFCGYYGGKIDMIMMRVVEILYGIPHLIIVILVMLVLGRGMPTMIVALCITGWIGSCRFVRGEVYRLKEQDYVLAAKVLGVSDFTIIVRHIIPNILGMIITNLCMAIPGAIFNEAFLSYIGLGIRPPQCSWGVLAKEGVANLRAAPHEVMIPAFFICVTMLALNLLGDGLRDAVDPKLRGTE
ncbi:ABC transporter permease [Cuneatibacter sp. NSJ-177]|jgi:oligopeptide transport system permease protein|uniref:ABC transporter permease n=1 Tax=Cuneatibacter sp. NSJ-177 TaxID=2931401 RepID=UPI001FD56812|nr:ABC transporter permease [Cuneatibacter sp. NSJ-177]MCJ7837202.1 ABC transporter permease [Cuneatibacter sp. NSJ-177]